VLSAASLLLAAVEQQPMDSGPENHAPAGSGTAWRKRQKGPGRPHSPHRFGSNGTRSQSAWENSHHSAPGCVLRPEPTRQGSNGDSFTLLPAVAQSTPVIEAASRQGRRRSHRLLPSFQGQLAGTNPPAAAVFQITDRIAPTAVTHLGAGLQPQAPMPTLACPSHRCCAWSTVFSWVLIALVWRQPWR